MRTAPPPHSIRPPFVAWRQNVKKYASLFCEKARKQRCFQRFNYHFVIILLLLTPAATIASQRAPPRWFLRSPPPRHRERAREPRRHRHRRRSRHRPPTSRAPRPAEVAAIVASSTGTTAEDTTAEDVATMTPRRHRNDRPAIVNQEPPPTIAREPRAIVATSETRNRPAEDLDRNHRRRYDRQR